MGTDLRGTREIGSIIWVVQASTSDRSLILPPTQHYLLRIFPRQTQHRIRIEMTLNPIHSSTPSAASFAFTRS